jgi:hypothetical protein
VRRNFFCRLRFSFLPLSASGHIKAKGKIGDGGHWLGKGEMNANGIRKEKEIKNVGQNDRPSMQIVIFVF